MPPRLCYPNSRVIPYRAKSASATPRFLSTSQVRWTNDGARIPPTTEHKGSNDAKSLHVSEEAAELAKSTGETPPDIGQGTPVQEILERDSEAKDKAPEVLKDKMNSSQSQKPNAASKVRSYSTSARRNAIGYDVVPSTAATTVGMEYPDGGEGHKFALPATPLQRTDNFRTRYDAVVDQLTKSLMRHGKLSSAQKNMSIILDTLRTAPPPQVRPDRPLLAGSPQASVLPLSPIEYLTAAIDSVAPLIKIRQQRGVAGGGASLPIPVPLGVRQRRRTAMKWILDAAENRRETRLADRVAREIINIAEGNGSAWDKRAQVHKMGVTARSNVRLTTRRR